MVLYNSHFCDYQFYFNYADFLKEHLRTELSMNAVNFLSTSLNSQDKASLYEHDVLPPLHLVVYPRVWQHSSCT